MPKFWMSNFNFQVLSRNKEDIQHSCRILLGDENTVSHFGPDPDGGIRLYLFTVKDHDATPLPLKMKAEQSANMLWEWLQDQPKEAWGESPEIDGSSTQAYTLTAHSDYKVGSYILCKPAWALYHK